MWIVNSNEFIFDCKITRKKGKEIVTCQKYIFILNCIMELLLQSTKILVVRLKCEIILVLLNYAFSQYCVAILAFYCKDFTPFFALFYVCSLKLSLFYSNSCYTFLLLKVMATKRETYLYRLEEQKPHGEKYRKEAMNQYTKNEAQIFRNWKS